MDPQQTIAPPGGLKSPHPSTNPAHPAPEVSLSHRSSTWLRQYGLVFALFFIGGGLSLANPYFLTWANLLNVLLQIAINGILAVGVTIVLLTGGVDLSLGSIVALAGVVAAHCAHPEQFPVVVPICAGVLAGALCGLANGVVITWGRVAPFIVTLGMMTVGRGLALIFSKGRPVSDLSTEFRYLGSGEVLGIPVPVLILFTVAISAWIFLKHLRFGRYIYAVGGNEAAAHAAGLPVKGIKTFAYVVSGGLAGLAGVVLAGRISTGQPNAGIAYELDAIAAVVIGGTSLSGGVGSVLGTVLGALLMGVINNGLDLMHVSAYYQQVVKGLIIIGAVWLDRRNQS